jgi:hypothetical protein
MAGNLDVPDTAGMSNVLETAMLAWLFAMALTAQAETPSPKSAPEAKPAAGPNESKPMALGDTGLTMVLPPDCVAEAKAGLRFFALRPAGERPGISVNVADQGPLRTPIDVAAVRKELVDALSKLMVSYRMRADGVRKVAGKDAYWISSEFEQGEEMLRNLQILLPTKPGFCVTFTTTAAAFDELTPEIDAAMATIAAGATLRGAKVANVRTEGARHHVDEQRFSLELPADWQPGDASVAAGAFFFAAGVTGDGFAPNVNVRAIAGMAKLDAAALEKEIRSALPAALSKCVVDEVKAVKLGKLPSLRTRATYELPIGELAMVQYVIAAQPSSFVVTYTTRRPAMAEAFAMIDKSAASIQIAPADPGQAPSAGKK